MSKDLQYLDLSNMTPEQVESLKKAIREMPNHPMSLSPLSQDLQVIYVGDAVQFRKYQCLDCATLFAVDMEHDVKDAHCPMCGVDRLEEIGIEEMHVPSQRHD